MAVSRERYSSFSELQLPYVFNKERPFETSLTSITRRTRQDTLEDTCDECHSFELKHSDITIEEEKCNPQEKKTCSSIFWRTEESNDLTEKFAPHQIALEQIQEKMRTFLKEEARKLVPIEPEEMSYRRMLIKAFWDEMRLIKLKQLFRFSFFHEICLRRIENIASANLEPLREAILETEEIVQTSTELLHKAHESSSELDHKIERFDNSFIESKTKVENLFEESIFFQGQLPIEDQIRYTTNESEICFALGLVVEFLDPLKSSNDELTFHWNLEDWILNFLSNNYEDLEDECLKKTLSRELLIKLGFRDNSQAIETIMSRSSLMTSGHVEPIDFVQRFVRDELKYNPVLSQELYRFPYLNTANVLYKLKAINKSVVVINVGTIEKPDENASKHPKYIDKYLDEVRDTDAVILFHGTDHCSALDIIHRGIDVNHGLPKRDFSDGKGFYLADNYENSETWAFSQTRKPVVLVFKVPKSFLDKTLSLDLRGEENKPDWLQIVTNCRSGRTSKKLRRRLKTYDTIKGPISVLCHGITEHREPVQDTNQLCIISEDCAEQIRSFLHTVLFYESSIIES